LALRSLALAFGRRRPFIALGAPLCALAFYALFTPPETMGVRAAQTGSH
jgi:Na+/melibiose symporter-like transporter